MKNYCLGFAFPRIVLQEEEVILIQKEKPAFQKGKLNGVGGKVEDMEPSQDAMVREFFEETGVQTTRQEWRHVCTLFFEDAQVDVFAACDVRFWSCKTTTNERVDCYKVSALWCEKRMSNLAWLVPMALASLQNPVDFHPLMVENFPS